MSEIDTDFNLNEPLLEHGIIWLTEELTMGSATAALKRLQLLESRYRQHKDSSELACALLYITSTGGDRIAAIALIDVIRALSIPVIGIGLGCVCSSAVYVLASCDKRLAYENTRFLLHHGQAEIPTGSNEELRAHVDEDECVNKILLNLLVQFTKQPPERLTTLLERETYLGAKEAKELGIIDSIIGEENI